SPSVSRSMTPNSIPDPPLLPPANASPETLSSAREYASRGATSDPPELEADEAPHLHVFAGLGGKRLDHVADRLAAVPHELLLEQGTLLVEAVDAALDDLLFDGLGLFLLRHLGEIDLPLLGDHVGRDVLATHGDRRRGRDLVRQVLGELLELLGVGDEVGLA